MKKISVSYERIDKRGVFREYVNSGQCWKSVNYGEMKRGAIMGNHYHKKTKAAFFILSGAADFFIKNIRTKTAMVKFILKKGEGVLIKPYETHTIRFREKSSFLLLKSVKFEQKNTDLYETKLIRN